MLTFKGHEKFIAEILWRIPAEAKRLQRSRSREFRNGETKRWTRAVKDAFFRATEEPEYKQTIDYFGTRPGCHEWLLDVVLYREVKNVLKGGLVAVESEWGFSADGIKFDFMRLLSFKAPLKILIIGIGGRRIDAVKKKIEECARGFEQHQSGEVYYLINFHSGRHDVYRYTTGRTCANGRAKVFTFKYLSRFSDDDA